MDLILPDQKNYIKNITQVMKDEFLSKCQSSEEGGNVFPYLVSAMCVSARTGHNIEVGLSFYRDRREGMGEFPVPS